MGKYSFAVNAWVIIQKVCFWIFFYFFPIWIKFFPIWIWNKWNNLFQTVIANIFVCQYQPSVVWGPAGVATRGHQVGSLLLLCFVWFSYSYWVYVSPSCHHFISSRKLKYWMWSFADLTTFSMTLLFLYPFKLKMLLDNSVGG